MSQSAPRTEPNTLVPAPAVSSPPALPETPRGRSLWLVLLSILGPGVIAAAAGNDAGGIATYSQAGAQFGISLLWSIALVTIGLIVVQEMAARMGAVTGKGLAALIRENFGVKITLFAMAVLVIANFATTVTEFAGLRAVGEMLPPRLAVHSRFVVMPASVVLVWLLVSRGSYQRFERILLIASMVFLTYIVAAVKIGVPWQLAFANTFEVHLTTAQWKSPALVTMIVQLIGTTIAPYMQFYQQSAVRDKGVVMKEYFLTRWDTIIGCLLSNIVAWFIVIACYQTLFKAHINNIPDAATAAQALKGIVPGEYASLLFAFGLLNASLMAAVIVPLSTAYAVTESLGWESGLGRRIRELPLFYGTYGTMIVLAGLLIMLVPAHSNLIQIILDAQNVNCALLPVILVLMLLLINRRRVMGTYRNSVGFNVVAWATTIITALFSLTNLALTLFSPH
jgi:NRAMP (natural resistance-associated macrophage protein)-like metal ion transporter